MENRTNLLEQILKMKRKKDQQSNNKIKNQDSNNFHDIINRIENCGNFKFIISSPFLPNVQLRKFFKFNGGIYPHVNDIYYINLNITYYKDNYKYDDNDVHTYKAVSIFEFSIMEKTYYGYILIDDNNGDCRTCQMGYSHESKMYFAETLDHLINYELSISDLDKLSKLILKT
jgi:hypothetical protein